MDEQLITEVTGHRYCAVINNKRTTAPHTFSKLSNTKKVKVDNEKSNEKQIAITVNISVN